MNKKKPLRRCMGCNQPKEKNELLRIVRTDKTSVEIDLSGKKNGRGAYICKDELCLNKVMKSNRLEKVLEMKIDEDFYESVRNIIIDK